MGIPLGCRLAVMHEGEADAGLCQCDTADDFCTMPVFGLFGFQEFAACGRIGIKLMDVDGRAEAAGTGA